MLEHRGATVCEKDHRSARQVLGQGCSTGKMRVTGLDKELAGQGSTYKASVADNHKDCTIALDSGNWQEKRANERLGRMWD